MDKTFRRIVSFVMAMAIVLSIGGLNVLAITEEDEVTLHFGASNVTVTKSNEAQPVSISFYISEDAEIASFGVQNISISDPNQMGVTFAGNAVVANTSFSGMNNIVDGSTTGGITMSDITAGHHMTYNSELNGYVLFTLPLTIPANATGTATVTFSQISAADNEIGDGYSVNSTPVTATIEVKEPEEEADPDNPKFTVYYQIDGTDSDNDNFYEVEPGATVDVGVYVKADSAQTMQAFDIYPEWDTNGLEYVSVTSAVDGVSVVDTEMGKENPHFLTNLTSDEDGTNVTIPTTGIQIATMKMEVKDTVIYGTEYPIWIEAATNLAKAKDPESVKSVTVQAKDTIGVVTYKTYEVKFDDNQTNATVTVPETRTKQHGVSLNLPEMTGTLDGWKFTGWNTDADGSGRDYEDKDTYNENAGVTLYAQWEKDTFPVTFNLNGQPNATPAPETQNVVNGGNATKPADPEVTGYTFGGWYTDEACSEGKAFDFENTVITQATELFAKWTINSYDVTFNMNGKGGDNTTVPVEHGEKVTAREVSNITGYTFDGWYTEADCEKKFDFNTPITEPKTLYAKWTPVEVTVTLNVNGGDALDQNSITVTYGEKYTNLPTNPNKTGYTFDGWYDDSNNKVTTETVVTNAAAHELTAKWNVNTYTVKFNPGTGGTGTPYTQEFKYDVTDKLTPNAFTASEEGYSFAGWATEAGGEVVYKNGQAVSKLATSGEVNLYAVWKQNTINYVSDPTGVKMNLELLPDSYTLGKKLEITAKPTAEGYTFNGWSNEALSINTKNDPNAFIIIPDTATGNIELTAHWTINQYSITFDSVGGTAVDKITENYGTEIAEPNDPTKPGHTFMGWYEDAAYKTAVNFPYTLKDNETLYAKWEINEYTVTFKANGHGTAPAEQTVEYDATAKDPGTLTETGYTFGGWYTEAGCKNKFDFTTKIVDDVALYAKWTENTYTITFGGDASGEDAKENVKYTEDVTLPTITKPGYDLVGWTDEETGTTAKYTEEIVSGLVTENGGSITLYPIWTEAEYIVTFAWGDHAADPYAKVPDAIKVTYNDKYPTLPADVAPANGYKFDGWYIGETKIQTDDTVKITTGAEAVAKYSKIKYTITFDPKGGVVSPETMDYYVSTTNLTLPTPTWENHTFVKWVVKADEGSWHKNSKFEITTAGNWGNVEVYAEWESSVTTVVESYKYAMDGYVMLRIPTDANANAYTFNGVKMFYTDDGEYKIDGKAVFVTLVPENNGQEGDALVSYVANGKLTDAGLALLKQGSEEATVIDRTSGRINMNDEIVNIADANAVYQMVEFGGGYYRETQLSIEKRLMADMFTEYTEGDARGTLQDVNEIVKLINAAANETTNP